MFDYVLAQRTIMFLTENNHIDKAVQKGIMEKISGCVEHTEAVRNDGSEDDCPGIIPMNYSTE